MNRHQPGLVVAAWRRHFAVRLDGGEIVACVLKGRRTALACGDRVAVARIAGGGAIESVETRSSLISRSDAFREKLVAANVDQVAAVVAPDLPVDDELVHRWSIAAALERCRYVVVLNKSDLPGFDALRERLAPLERLGATLVGVCAKRDVGPLAPLFAGRRSVLIGQSGMGKSTVLNGLVPGAQARVGEVSAALDSGRHTTTEAALYALEGPDDGWIVDSPGMKTFGLAHVDPGRIDEAFVDIAPYIGRCRFRDCRHDREPGCAVREAEETGKIASFRVGLLHALRAEATAAGRRS